MKATETMMDFFHAAEQMLTEEIVFNKNTWREMVNYLRTTHLFRLDRDENAVLKDKKSNKNRNLLTMRD